MDHLPGPPLAAGAYRAAVSVNSLSGGEFRASPSGGPLGRGRSGVPPRRDYLAAHPIIWRFEHPCPDTWEDSESSGTSPRPSGGLALRGLDPYLGLVARALLVGRWGERWGTVGSLLDPWTILGLCGPSARPPPLLHAGDSCCPPWEFHTSSPSSPRRHIIGPGHTDNTVGTYVLDTEAEQLQATTRDNIRATARAAGGQAGPLGLSGSSPLPPLSS